jgi:hypothetical protein
MDFHYDSRLAIANRIKKAQKEFAKQRESQKARRIGAIATELQTLCLKAAEVGSTKIDIADRLEPGDAAEILELCYILIHEPGILQPNGLLRYSFEIKIPLE